MKSEIGKVTIQLFTFLKIAQVYLTNNEIVFTDFAFNRKIITFNTFMSSHVDFYFLSKHCCMLCKYNRPIVLKILLLYSDNDVACDTYLQFWIILVCTYTLLL